MTAFHFTGDPSNIIEECRRLQKAIEDLRRDFVYFRTDDGGMRFVRVADVISLHEWELDNGTEQ